MLVFLKNIKYTIIGISKTSGLFIAEKNLKEQSEARKNKRILGFKLPITEPKEQIREYIPVNLDKKFFFKDQCMKELIVDKEGS